MPWYGAEATLWSPDRKSWFCACGRQGGGNDPVVVEKAWQQHTRDCPYVELPECVVCRSEFIPAGRGDEGDEMCSRCRFDTEPEETAGALRAPRSSSSLTVKLSWFDK